MARILIVDDDTAFRESLAEMLGDLGHGVSQAPTVAAGLQILQAGSVDAAIVDLRMPGEDGLAFLRKARGLSRAPCIMLTAYASGGNTIEAMRLGAFDHLTKPIARTALVEALDRALQGAGPAQDSGDGQAGQPQMHDDGELVSGSEAMRQVFKRIGLAADSDATVLVLGETGTGKELVAQAVHAQSARAGRALVSINCAALPDNLVESELFGHVRGAFTGALSERSGKFEQADQGTLFLDEVGELSLAVQAKLLRVLQSGQLQRLGSDREHHVDVRVIAATNRDLAAEVAAGRMRADFFHRLSVYPLRVPALRERDSDVLMLAGFFLEENRSRLGLGGLRLHPAAQSALLAQDWPGNVRELEHLISRGVLRALSRAPSGTPAGGRARMVTLGQADLRDDAQPPATATPTLPVPQAASPGASPQGLREAVESYERHLIDASLQRHHGSWAAAARELQMDRANLQRLARRLGLA